ncbi:MAG: PfkB family carbohydrate kinase [Candidatus Gastranaerophilales bacterium]|nr:PfkB family carbohydrate kinase [Candidatus Gastranaerophilales bacterium]
MFSFDKEDLKAKLAKIMEPSVLVVGDLAIDEMIYGNTARMSREAPVLILRHYDTKVILGAASNAAHNISALNNGKVSVIGTFGDDLYAPILIDAFKKTGVNTDYMVQDKDRATTVKTRISGSCSQSITQQIVRIDRETTAPLSADIENKIIQNLEKAIPQHDAVILSDYNIGMMTPNVISQTISIAKKYGKVVVVDAQKNLERYKGATAMTPNQPDTEGFIGYCIKDENSLAQAGKDMLSKTENDIVLVTRGGDGMCVFEQNGKMSKIPVFNKTDVFDVTGAGDTVVASFTLGLAAGLAPKEAAIVGNLAASIVIRHFGCATTSVSEISKTLDKLNMDDFTIKV